MDDGGDGGTHTLRRMGWLRAAVLGANDGIVSTASLIIGVAASGAGRPAILVAGMAALVAGAMSMAAGEYVSVSSQADAERAELRRESREIARNAAREHEELADIYVERGLDAPLARQVAGRLMAHDALGAHARDELGIFEHNRARPLQAALASAASFAGGAAPPLLLAGLAPLGALPLLEGGFSLLCLAGLGALAARAGRAPVARAVVRVVGWSALAMALTALIGRAAGALV